MSRGRSSRALTGIITAGAVLIGGIVAGRELTGELNDWAATGDLQVGQDTATTVQRVVDGDTIVVTGGQKVRIVGIDTPETVDPSTPVECAGPEASARAKELLPHGEAIRLVGDDTDRYGRRLATITVEATGLDYGLVMLREGWARVYEQETTEEYRAAEADARDHGTGLWGMCR